MPLNISKKNTASTNHIIVSSRINLGTPYTGELSIMSLPPLGAAGVSPDQVPES